MAFHNGESSFCLSLFHVCAGTNTSHGNILGQFQWENALRHSNRLWSKFLRSQKSSNWELIYMQFPWIPVLPGLLEGNKTRANNTVWRKTQLKKPRVRTVSKPYGKPVIFIPLRAVFASFSFNYHFPGGWRQKAILYLVLSLSVYVSPSGKFDILHRHSRAQLSCSVLTSGNF